MVGFIKPMLLYFPNSVSSFMYSGAPMSIDSSHVPLQAATRSSGMTMSAAPEGVSRRAALGAFFAGAAAIPGNFSLFFYMYPLLVIFWRILHSIRRCRCI